MTIAPSDMDSVADLRSHLDATLGQVLHPGEPVALLDFPSYENVGDSAIYLGQARSLRRLGHPIVYAADIGSFTLEAARRHIGRAPVLITGGGNFGDLWTAHQRFRERVITAFPDNRVIQLPQTLRFQTSEALQRAREIFARHPDVTLMVRDDASEQLALEHFRTATVVSCPDGAFGIGALTRLGRPVTDVLWLVRTDSEAEVRVQPPAGALTVDWRGQTASRHRTWSYRIPNALTTSTTPKGRLLARVPLLLRARPRLYERMAFEEVARGVRLLSQGHGVVTDRLHAHILCLLAGIPHVLVDSGYGKLAGFHRRWTSGHPLVRFTDDVAEAGELSRELAASVRRQLSS